MVVSALWNWAGGVAERRVRRAGDVAGRVLVGRSSCGRRDLRARRASLAPLETSVTSVGWW